MASNSSSGGYDPSSTFFCCNPQDVYGQATRFLSNAAAASAAASAAGAAAAAALANFAARTPSAQFEGLLTVSCSLPAPCLPSSSAAASAAAGVAAAAAAAAAVA